MGGLPELPFRVRVAENRPVSGTAAFDALIDEITQQRDDPPSGDIGTSFMWDALLWARQRGRAPHVDEVLREFTASSQTIVEPFTVQGSPAASLAARVRIAMQYAAMNQGTLPRTPLGWKRKVPRIFGEASSRSTLIRNLGEPNHNARGRRYGPVEVSRQLGGFANFVDAGSSVPEGVWQTQLKNQFPFPSVEFRFRNGRRDILASQGYAHLVGLPELGGEVVTSDIRSPADEELQELSFAALRQGEILSPGERQARRRLFRLGRRLGNVLFIKANVTDRNTMAELRERCHGRRFLLACLLTVLHEVGQENIPTAMDNMLELLDDHPDSQLIVAEHAQVDRRRRSTLSLLPRWAPGTYSYFGVAKQDASRHVQHLYTFDTSRPTNGVVAEGLFRARGEVLPMRDYLVRAATQVVMDDSGLFLPALHTTQ